MYLRHCLLVVVASSMLASCGLIPGMDDVVTDRRKEYRKSESLPELEIPPDLTLEADVDPLLIPDEEITTYSEYQRQRDLRSGGATGGSEVIDLGSEQVIVLSGAALDPERCCGSFRCEIRDFFVTQSRCTRRLVGRSI